MSLSAAIRIRPFGRLGLGDRRRRQVRQLRVVGVLEEELVQARGSPAAPADAPAQDHRLDRASTSGRRLERRADRDRLAPLDLEAVIHQQVRPSGDHVVAQQVPPLGAKRQLSESPQFSLTQGRADCNTGDRLDARTRAGAKRAGGSSIQAAPSGDPVA